MTMVRKMELLKMMLFTGNRNLGNMMAYSSLEWENGHWNTEIDELVENNWVRNYKMLPLAIQ